LAIVADAVRGPMSVWSTAIEQDARELRRASAETDNELVRITARQAPVAGDLRLVLALIQVAQHLGLIANQFELIAQQLDAIEAAAQDGEMGDTLAEMARLAGEQLHRALRALVARDVAVARDIDHDDDAIDRLNRRVFEAALRLDVGPSRRELALRRVLIARSLERVGDNAVDIAEQVVFLVTAERSAATAVGTRSPVALAIAPPPADPTIWPPAQARFINAAPRPWCRSWASAASESIAIVGAQKPLSDSQVPTTSRLRSAAVCGRVKQAMAIAVAASPMRSGARRP
jgi:phosphate transport system protein